MCGVRCTQAAQSKIVHRTSNAVHSFINPKEHRPLRPVNNRLQILKKARGDCWTAITLANFIVHRRLWNTLVCMKHNKSSKALLFVFSNP
jgi:hypothetical protein